VASAQARCGWPSCRPSRRRSSARSFRGAIDQAKAVVVSDDWKGYGDLTQHGADHCPIVQGDPKNAAVLLPWSHIVFSNLEGWLRGTFHGVSAKHLHRYLQEFVYRTKPALARGRSLLPRATPRRQWRAPHMALSDG
jgi:hypothetical protein